VIVEKAAWHHGELHTTLFEPFEVLRRSNQESYRKEKEIGGSVTDLKDWLPEANTPTERNLRISGESGLGHQGGRSSNRRMGRWVEVIAFQSDPGGNRPWLRC
jgi:hypothetical protein